MWLAWIALCTAFLIPPTGTAPAPGSASEKVGKVEPRELGGRRIWIYTPPGYDEAAKTPYDLLIVFDGEQYVEDFALPKMLDALLAERAAPAFVTVMIDDGSGAVRLADLANRESFAAYLSAELLPYVRRQWTVTSNPRATVVSGSSAGELAAAFVAYRHPELFGNVLSQSGAFWRGNEGSNDPPYEWLTAQYEASPKKDIRFVLEVGSRESRGALGGAAPSILEANRRLRGALAKVGYRVAYLEVPGGEHSPESWKQRLPAAIAAMVALAREKS